MKTFILACVVLGLILGGITANALFIHKISTELIEKVSRLPESIEHTELFAACLETVNELDETMKKHRLALSITVTHADLEGTENLLLRLRAACREKNADDYGAARELLIAKIHNLQESEGFSLDGVI